MSSWRKRSAYDMYDGLEYRAQFKDDYSVNTVISMLGYYDVPDMQIPGILMKFNNFCNIFVCVF